MKKTIWAFTEDLEDYPSPQTWSKGFPTGKMDLMVFPLYIVLWGITAHVLYIPSKNRHPLLYGFFSGLIFLILYHIWAFGSWPFSDNTGFVLMQQSKSLAIFESGETNRILLKSPYNSFLKKKKLWCCH